MKEMEKDNSIDFIARPLEDDIFVWHFIIRGPSDTDYVGGVYHGRIMLPAEYPFKPPDFMFLSVRPSAPGLPTTHAHGQGRAASDLYIYI